MRSRALQLTGISALLWLVAMSAVHANAGTPLRWAGTAHLVAGNFVIGVLEGLLLARAFRVPSPSAVALMVAANYVSAFGFLLGFPVVRHVRNWALGDAPLYRVPETLALLLGVTFLISVLVEWPFCWGALRRAKHPWRRALVASLVAQCASYCLLVPFYLLVSPITLYTETRLDRSLSFVRQPNAWVYYLAPAGDVYRIRMDGRDRQRVLDHSKVGPDARLTARNAAPGRWDLWLTAHPQQGTATRLFQGLPGRVGVDEAGKEQEPHEEFGNGMNAWEPLELRVPGAEEWDAWLGFWASQGVQLTHRNSGRETVLAMETPWLAWEPRNATMLPGDQLLFQLDDQIVVLDLPTRKLGLLVRGSGPVVCVTDAPPN